MRHQHCDGHPPIRDYGGEPFVCHLQHAATMNENFRTTLWTGQNLQLTLMSIPVCGEIGVEMHDDVDQFLYVIGGIAHVYTGSCRGDLQEGTRVERGDAILLPAGTWHNMINAGRCPLKLYSLYAPPQHPAGTVHRTKEEAERAGH